MRAVVRNGRLLLDEPTALPDGTEVELVADDGADDLDPTERAALETTIDRAVADLRAGRGIPADIVLARLHARHA